MPLANRFHDSCVSIDNDRRPGRPRTSTDEISMKLVADALEEDYRQHVKNFLESQEFQQHHYSVSWLMIQRRETFLCDGYLTARLLNRSRNAWTVRPCWKRDSTLQIKHFCIELLMDFKKELKSQSNEWTAATGSLGQKHFDELNQRSSEITKESSRQNSMWKSVTGVYYCVLMQKLFRKITRTDFSFSWLDHSFSMTMLACTSWML